MTEQANSSKFRPCISRRNRWPGKAPCTLARPSGGYEIISLIGAGGMGDVYLAEDIQLRRRVALKLVRAAMRTDDIVARFRHEEQILASLNDPNIAHLYGSGLTANGIPFFVMEYVEGLRIDQYCDRHDLSTAPGSNSFAKSVPRCITPTSILSSIAI